MICRETTAKHTRFEASIFRSCWGLELGPSPKARTRRGYLYGNLKAYQLLCAFWLLISLSLCDAAETRQVRNATNTFEPWLPACLLACITKIWDDLNDPSAGKFIHQSVNREKETRVCCSKWFSVHLSRVIKRGREREGDRRESDTWSFGCCCRIGVYHLCMMVTCKSRLSLPASSSWKNNSNKWWGFCGTVRFRICSWYLFEHFVKLVVCVLWRLIGCFIFGGMWTSLKWDLSIFSLVSSNTQVVSHSCNLRYFEIAQWRKIISLTDPYRIFSRSKFWFDLILIFKKFFSTEF